MSSVQDIIYKCFTRSLTVIYIYIYVPLLAGFTSALVVLNFLKSKKFYGSYEDGCKSVPTIVFNFKPESAISYFISNFVDLFSTNVINIDVIELDS